MRSLMRVRLSATAREGGKRSSLGLGRSAMPPWSAPSPSPSLRQLSQPDGRAAFFHTGALRLASVDALYGTGPPPDPPVTPEAAAAARDAEERAVRIARRRSHAAATKGRFWKGVSVKEEGEEGHPNEASHLSVALDARPLRHPTTRQVLRLPPRKRVLAHALAVEWDQLTGVRQATQAHRVPLTSLVCRALDLGGEKEEEEEGLEGKTDGSSRNTTAAVAALRAPLIDNLLRYLDTDSLLCWEPPETAELSGAARTILGATAATDSDGRPRSLRQMQEATVTPLLAYLRQNVWQGVDVRPVLGDGDGDASSSLLPRPHPPETRAAVRAWLASLDGFALAGVERATLAGKSLVLAARLVAGWQAQQQEGTHTAEAPLTVDDAVRAANLETAFQTAQWGEVEDTHDVDKEDLRRHFASVVLLVAE